MPVSATEKTTSPFSGHARRHPHLSTLGELQRVGDEIPEDLRDFAFVGKHRRDVIHIFEYQIDGLIQQQRPQHAAQSGEQIRDAKLHWLGFHLTGFHFGQVQKIVHQVKQIARRLANVLGLLFLLGRSIPRPSD